MSEELNQVTVGVEESQAPQEPAVAENKLVDTIETNMNTEAENPTQNDASKPATETVQQQPHIEQSSPNDKKQYKEIFTEEEKKEAVQEVYAEILKHFETFSPSEEVSRNITDEHITEYLEGSRELKRREFIERREKRILIAFELAAVLGSIVAIVRFLNTNPAVLVNILYIIGGLIALWIWKYPHHTDDK